MMRGTRIVWPALFAIVLLALVGVGYARAAALPATDEPTPSATNTPTPTPTPSGGGGGGGHNNDEGITLGEAMGRYWQQLTVGAGVGTAYVLANALWFITRLAMSIVLAVLDPGWSQQMVDNTLQRLQADMPGVLQAIMLGQNGLLYLALAIVGLTMVFPFLMRGSPVRIDRVFIWAALILGLFAGSEAMGYNIISLFEHTRTAMFQTVLGLGADETAGALQGLVLEPWRATQADIQLDLNFRLPQAFQQEFFPEPETETITVNVARAWWRSEWIFETPTSLERRREGAFQGLFWGSIGVYGVVVLGFVAFAAAALALASVVLIILFLATLPLALFSFGEALVLRVVQRWIGVVAATIFLAVFLRVTTGWVQALSLAGGEVDSVVMWFIWLTLMLIVFGKFAHLAVDMFAGALFLVGAITGAAFGARQLQGSHGAGARLARGVGGAALAWGGVLLSVASANPHFALAAAKHATPMIASAIRPTGQARHGHRAFRGHENVFMARA